MSKLTARQQVKFKFPQAWSNEMFDGRFDIWDDKSKYMRKLGKCTN